METIACATVISANRPGLWQCHERYADKQVTRKARHISHGEVPYEKTKVVPGNGRIISSLILSWLHKLYALQRVLHYGVNLYANERLVWHRLA